jgi:hypothetical protein
MKKNQTQSLKLMKWKDAIDFLIRLAALQDPTSARIGDRLNLIDDLRRYLEIEDTGRLSHKLKQAENKPNLLTPVSEVAQKLLAAAADHKVVEFEFEKIQLRFDGTKLGDSRSAIFFDGELQDAVAQTAAEDLDEAEPWQIGRCEEQECGKVFLAGRKGQKYCSHACANATAARAYREANKGKRAQVQKRRYWRKKVSDKEDGGNGTEA